MARYGYIRLDAREREVGRQAAQLDTIGGFDRIAVERPARGAGKAAGGSAAGGATGAVGPAGAAHAAAPSQWERLVAALQADDLVVVASADRIADSARRFLEVVVQVREKGAHLNVLEEGIDTRTTTGRHILRAVESLTRIEREGMSQRKKDGIREARAQGRRIGRPPLPQPVAFRETCRDWSEGRIDFREAAERSGMKTTSFFKKAKELGFRPPLRKRD
jgi:hypothetical protein